MDTAVAERKKVITLATRYSIGGAQMNARLLASELNLRGYVAEAWFLMRAGVFDFDDGVPTRIIHDSVTKNPLKIIRLFLLLRKRILDLRPDVIIGFHPLANIFGAILARSCGGIEFIATQRNPSSSQTLLLKYIERVIGSTSMYFKNIAVSNAVKSSYGDYPAAYRQKMEVIHNGLPPLIKIQLDQAQCREQLALPLNVPLIGALGRLAPQKNPEFLLELLPYLPGVHLAYAGDGPNHSLVCKRASELGVDGRVHFTGALSGDDVTKFYRALDVFLLPSHFEGFGRTIVEAMQEALPIVANELPVTSEVILDAGFLRPLDAAEWANVIDRILVDRDFRQSVILKSRARGQYFTVEKMVDGYMKVIADAVQRRECKR